MVHIRGLGECPEMFGDVDGIIPTRPSPGRPCTRCGEPLMGRRMRWCSDACARWYSNNHQFDAARLVKLREARLPDGRCLCSHCGGATAEPEVDHIVAAKGRHRVRSCIHHQDNLRVLCKSCHRERTRRQRAGSLEVM